MSTLKNAFTGGVVAGGGLVLVLLLLLYILGPVLIAGAWFFDLITFEAAAIALLLLNAYLTGSGGE